MAVTTSTFEFDTELSGDRDPALHNEDLEPLAPEKRRWGWFEIFNVWTNDVQSLAGYTLAASLFITFVLSEEGQRLLLRPDVHRIPAHTGVRDEAARLLDPAWAALDFTQAPYDLRTAVRN